MSGRERRRLEWFSRVKDGELSVSAAGELLGLSERQARRVWKRYRQLGAAGLVHGLRGRRGNAARGSLRERAMALYVEHYGGLGMAHAAELMGLEHQLSVSRQTLWRWLKGAGLVSQQRRVSKHRIRRARRGHVGELVQMDGSTHAWLGQGRGLCVLFVMIDDASSRVWARFYESEDTASAFDLFGGYARRYGLPSSLYVDRDSIYRVNDERAREHVRQAGKRPPLTQFGRAMAELEVSVIFANSPQAKGRVERVNRTLQDRLVKELAMHGITTLSGANAYLDDGFLERLHKLIGVKPRETADHHRPAPAGRTLAGDGSLPGALPGALPGSLPGAGALDEVLCMRELRTVGKDWCVRYENRYLQIDAQHESGALAGKRVAVLQLADGTLQLRRQGLSLRFKELATAPVTPSPPKRSLAARTPWRPGPDHPWKRVPVVVG